MAQHSSPTSHCCEGVAVFFLWLLFFLADFLLGVPLGFSEASEMSPFFRACLNEATALSYAFINAVSSQMSESSLSPVPRRNSTESSGSGKPPLLPPPPPVLLIFTIVYFVSFSFFFSAWIFMSSCLLLIFFF